jgi:hypothetical protein
VDAAEYLTVAKIFEVEKVVIVGLNSCRLHEKRNAGLGYVGRDQFEEVVRTLRHNEVYKQTEDQFFKIAVLHHHLLPAADLDLRELDKPPSEREFSLTIDADSVMDLLLADNFALLLHGHLHIPFCGVERRLPVTVNDPPANSGAHIAVAGAGSLCVDTQYAEQNHYQVIDLDSDSVTIVSLEIEHESGIVRDFRHSRVSLERRLLTQPVTRLSLRPYDDHMLDVQSRKLEESAILAERVFQNDRVAIEFLFRSLVPVCKRTDQLASLSELEMRAHYDSVLAIWFADRDALQKYEDQKKHRGLTFTEYFLRLMIVAYAI